MSKGQCALRMHRFVSMGSCISRFTLVVIALACVPRATVGAIQYTSPSRVLSIGEPPSQSVTNNTTGPFADSLADTNAGGAMSISQVSNLGTDAITASMATNIFADEPSVRQTSDDRLLTSISFLTNTPFNFSGSVTGQLVRTSESGGSGGAGGSIHLSGPGVNIGLTTPFDSDGLPRTISINTSGVFQAGQAYTLDMYAFSNILLAGSGPGGLQWIQSMSMNLTTVPEPASLALFAILGLTPLARRRRR